MQGGGWYNTGAYNLRPKWKLRIFWLSWRGVDHYLSRFVLKISLIMGGNFDMPAKSNHQIAAEHILEVGR